MRKLYNDEKNNSLLSYFSHLIVKKYLLPLFVLLFVLLIEVFAFGIYIKQSMDTYTTIGFIHIVSINILVSITSVSIVNIIRTCMFAYKQIYNKNYVILQLVCNNKFRKGGKYYCTLSDKKTYQIYDRKIYNQIETNNKCDLIVISNTFGAKLWEIVLY